MLTNWKNPWHFMEPECSTYDQFQYHPSTSVFLVVLSYVVSHQKPVCTSILLDMHATFPAHLTVDFIIHIILGEENYEAPWHAFFSTFSFFGFEYYPQHPCFKHTVLDVRDQIWHPYKTTGKTMLLYILILHFFQLESEWHGSKYSADLIYLIFFLIKSPFVKVYKFVLCLSFSSVC
jgi:hypothetical protein